MVQTELEDTKSKQKMLYQAHAETVQKADLIEASVVALKKVTKLLLHLLTLLSVTSLWALPTQPILALGVDWKLLIWLAIVNHEDCHSSFRIEVPTIRQHTKSCKPIEVKVNIIFFI